MADFNKDFPHSRRVVTRRMGDSRSRALVVQPEVATRRRLEYLDPAILKVSRPSLRIDKGGKQEGLQRGLRRFGCVIPVLVDAFGNIVSGHSVTEAAIAIGLSEIPVIRVMDLSNAELRALRIALHAIEERGDYDPVVLRAELSFIYDAEVELLTFTELDSPSIDAILEPGEKSSKPNPDDTIPPMRRSAVTRRGDVWCFEAGHRIICGDARDPDAYARLMTGRMARAVISDPPYNVPVSGHVSGRRGAREFAATSGEMNAEEFTAFLAATFRLAATHSVDGSLHLHFMDWRHIAEMMDAGRAVYSELKNLIVWAKTNAGMGSLWRSQHELVFAWKLGTAPHLNNVELGRHGRWRSNVWHFPGANSFGPSRDRDLADHVTPKNVAMIKEAILDITRRGDVVLDCFCGAGPTLLAAHRARRVGMGIEIDPLYVDAAVLRIEERTKQTARHADTGVSFADTAAERARRQPAART